MVDDVIVFSYGIVKFLEIIKIYVYELAVVMIEFVLSCWLDL